MFLLKIAWNVDRIDKNQLKECKSPLQGQGDKETKEERREEVREWKKTETPYSKSYQAHDCYYTLPVLLYFLFYLIGYLSFHSF